MKSSEKKRLRWLSGIGILGLALGWPSLAQPNLANVPKVGTQRFEVSFDVQAGAAPIESVQLWYTRDDGKSWRQYGVGAGTDRSMSFNATEEGLYGFFVVAVSAAGASSPPPGPSSVPQFWAYVDYTPPVVQLHSIRQHIPRTVAPILSLRWSAIDHGLTGRPIELSYRAESDEAWTSIGGPMSNTGSFDWRVPDEVVGSVRVRITVRDFGGHVVEDTTGPFEIDRSAPEPASEVVTAAMARGIAAGVTEGIAARPDGQRSRGLALYQQGVDHARRGEYRLAVSRLTDALRLDPQMPEALAELGRALYAQGDLDRSVEAYHLALEQQPGSRDVLEGLSLAFIKQRQFGKAVQPLSRIVQANPKDAEAWLNLGDIAIYQGDELLAREHYQKAVKADPTAREVVERVRLRLSDLKRLANEFRQIEP